MNEYEMVWCQVESANNLFTATGEGDVFNLVSFSKLFGSKAVVSLGQPAFAIRVLSMAILSQRTFACVVGRHSNVSLQVSFWGTSVVILLSSNK